MTDAVARRPRRELDFYETAPWQVRSLLDWHKSICTARRILEPCVGDYAIAKVLRARVGDEQPDGTPIPLEIVTNDLDTRRRADLHMDAAGPGFWQLLNTRFDPDHDGRELNASLGAGGKIDWMVTNPPFNVAFDILRHARYHRPLMNVALLVRRSFLEPTEERGYWLARNPPQRAIVLPRYSFTSRRENVPDLLGEREVVIPGGSDNMTCEWLIWTAETEPRVPIVIADDGRTR